MIRFTSNNSNFYLHQQRSLALKYAKIALADGAPKPLVGWGGRHPFPDLTPSALVFQREPYVPLFETFRRPFGSILLVGQGHAGSRISVTDPQFDVVLSFTRRRIV